MKQWFQILAVGLFSSLAAEGKLVYSHEELKAHSMYGNCYRGIATQAMGAKQFEVWRATLAVGSKSPLHVHETEEIFIVLKGKIRAVVGDREVVVQAPGTLICPAHVPHQLFNVGDEPTDQILVLGIDSKIYSAGGEEMHLPWR